MSEEWILIKFFVFRRINFIHEKCVKEIFCYVAYAKFILSLNSIFRTLLNFRISFSKSTLTSFSHSSCYTPWILNIFESFPLYLLFLWMKIERFYVWTWSFWDFIVFINVEYQRTTTIRGIFIMLSVEEEKTVRENFTFFAWAEGI
jgi:hypothetical protein